MQLNKTICALATPPLVSALGIIRVSGNDAFSIVNKIFDKDVANHKSREIVYGSIVFKKTIIDEVIALFYPLPRSFTGENVVEIIFHGSPLIGSQIIEALVYYGATIAEPGEFSLRGYLNHKFDLIQAEAINDMITSSTNEAKNLSVLSLKGETTKLILPYKDAVASLLANIEVNIDFPEYEDIEEKSHADIDHEIKVILKGVGLLIANGREGKIIKNGIRIALVGKPNSGKSSLLNAIIKEEKAIVTNIPGTTRDVVEGEIVYKGIPMRFFDTAGIRKADNAIEQIGISKTKELLTSADLVVYVKDNDNDNIDDRDILLIDKKKLIVITNKADTIDVKKPGITYVSALKKQISPLLEVLSEKLGIRKESFVSPSFNNERQLNKLVTIERLLLEVLEANENNLPLDLISVPLQSAYREILELLGEEFQNDLTEEIFSRFCVGK